MSDTNLALDVDIVAGSSRSVARVAVTSFSGYTRTGSAPTITADCTVLEQFEAEIDRLRTELDKALTMARTEWAGRDADASSREAVAEAPVRRCAGELLVEDAMTGKPKTVRRNTPLAQADELMRAGRFRHLIVLDEEDQLAGVVSRRDIFYGALAWSQGIGKRTHEAVLASTPTKQVMTADVSIVSPKTPLREAAAKLVDEKISCLPVVHGTQVVGVLTEADVVALIRLGVTP